MDWQQFESDYLASFRSIAEDSFAAYCGLAFEAELSFFFDLSPIQDSFLFRSRYLGLRLAHLLIDEEGELQRDFLVKCVRDLEKGFFSLGPRRECDSAIYEHVLICLKALVEDKEIWRWIRKFSPPLCHKQAEEVIRQTLWPDSIRTVQSFHIRRAAVAAWLTLLRQTTGSCFATAPALLIQRKPRRFFKDLHELLGIGQLRRVIEGKQYAVPLCPSIYSVDLKKPFPVGALLSFSPGLLSAFTAAQLLPAQESMEKKAWRLEAAFKELPSLNNAEQVLRDLTLKSVGLTEEDVTEEEALSQIQMEPIAAKEGAVYYRRPTLRAQKVADWKKRLKAAKSAFQATTECILLRVWEYTLASFCDVKTDFAKWNLYMGLGMHQEQPGGIAAFLYQRIEKQLQDTNEETLRLQEHYERSVQTVRALEVLLQEAGDIRRLDLQGQIAGAINEVQRAFDEMDRCVRKAEAIAGFFATLMRYYDGKLQEYFQEVFEPSVSEIEGHLFEDSPTGFRLLYKHGRIDASSWEWIYDGETYIRSLRSFFAAVEAGVEMPSPLEREFIATITTELIQFIQTPEFLEGAKLRSQSIGKKAPWEYVSGGTMQSLIQAYYSRSEPLSENHYFPKSPMELLQILEMRQGNGNLLVHSPVHAFVLRMDLFPEKATEKIAANQAAIQKIDFEEEAQEFIGYSLSEKLPFSERALFLHLFKQKGRARNAFEFRQYLIETLQQMDKSSAVEERIDSHLYEHAFCLSKEQLKQALHEILKPWENKTIVEAISKTPDTSMGLYLLHQTAKSILLKTIQSPFDSVDWDEKLAVQIRKLGLAQPYLLLFADTNWSGWFFGFVANAITKEIELWRLNCIGTRGYPMNEWKRWFSSENAFPWIFLSRPEEYDEDIL